MQEPDAPGLRRYLHAAALWFAITQVFGFGTLVVLQRDAFAHPENFLFVFLPSLVVVLVGMAMLGVALSAAGIRGRGGLIGLGALAGFALTTLIVIGIIYALRDSWLIFWLVELVPGNFLGGAAAGAFLSMAVPREPEWWPSQRTW